MILMSDCDSILLKVRGLGDFFIKCNKKLKY